jgi:hypothetical protein
LAWKATKAALGKLSAEEAASKAAQVDYLSMRLKQRLIELPPSVDIGEFVQFGGTPPSDTPEVPAESRELKLTGFRDTTWISSMIAALTSGVRRCQLATSSRSVAPVQT